MGLVGLMGLMGGMGIRDGKRGDRFFTRLGKMFFRTGEEKEPGNRRKKRGERLLFHPLFKAIAMNGLKFSLLIGVNKIALQFWMTVTNSHS